MRDKGGAHIRLDMFADRFEPEVKQDKTEITTWREHAEMLKLSDGVVVGGTWSADVAGDGAGMAEAKFDDQSTGELAVTAKAPRLSPVTVTVTYTEPKDGETYTMNLTVFVTAKVELRPNAVTIFPNDTITVPLSAYGVEPVPNAAYNPITDVTLTVDPDVTGLSEPVSAEIDGTRIKLIRDDGEAGEEGQWADVTFTCKKGDYTSEETTQRIAVSLPSLPESWSEDGAVWTLDFSEYNPTELVAGLAGADPGFKMEYGSTFVTLRKLQQEAQFPEGGVKLTVTLTVPDESVPDGIVHELAIAVLPKPEEGG